MLGTVGSGDSRVVCRHIAAHQTSGSDGRSRCRNRALRPLARARGSTRPGPRAQGPGRILATVSASKFILEPRPYRLLLSLQVIDGPCPYPFKLSTALVPDPRDKPTPLSTALVDGPCPGSPGRSRVWFSQRAPLEPVRPGLGIRSCPLRGPPGPDSDQEQEGSAEATTGWLGGECGQRAASAGKEPRVRGAASAGKEPAGERLRFEPRSSRLSPGGIRVAGLGPPLHSRPDGGSARRSGGGQGPAYAVWNHFQCSSPI